MPPCYLPSSQRARSRRLNKTKGRLIFFEAKGTSGYGHKRIAASSKGFANCRRPPPSPFSLSLSPSMKPRCTCEIRECAQHPRNREPKQPKEAPGMCFCQPQDGRHGTPGMNDDALWNEGPWDDCGFKWKPMNFAHF